MRNRLPSGCRLRWPDGDCVMDMALGKNTRAVGMAKPHIGFVLQGIGAGGSERIDSLLCNNFAAQGWNGTLSAEERRGGDGGGRQWCIWGGTIHIKKHKKQDA